MFFAFSDINLGVFAHLKQPLLQHPNDLTSPVPATNEEVVNEYASMFEEKLAESDHLTV